MKYFFNIKNKVKRKINLNSLISNKKRLSKIYLSLLKSDKINIYDIGAGHRILNELINFDQISNIYLIDPNKNLDISYKKLIKNLKVNDNVYKFFNAISDKTQTRDYYQSINSTSSTFYSYCYGNNYLILDYNKKFSSTTMLLCRRCWACL